MNHVTQDQFEAEVLKADGAVVVYFGAEAWCAPCKALAPTLRQVSEEFAAKMKFFKVDVDIEDALTAKYDVMSIPTLILFKGGKEVAQLSGNKSKQELIDFVNQGL